MSFVILGVLFAAGVGFVVADNRRVRRARAAGRPLPNTFGGASLWPESRTMLRRLEWVAFGAAALVLLVLFVLAQLGPT